MKKLSLVSRVLIALSGASLLLMLSNPIWKILLFAPQYPEGLEMKIWATHFTGDVRVINALNHYIGMRHIEPEMFPEFGYLSQLIMVVAALGLVAAAIGRWWSALSFYLVLAAVDTLALVDFYRWGYDYGHKLDPTAPIVVPGMAYQPPVLGHKKLLNFDAWSLPDIGGWVIMGATTLVLGIVIWEWWRNRKLKKLAAAEASKTLRVSVQERLLTSLLLPIFFLQACSNGGPVPLNFGKDNCDHCRMTLTDNHYGAEVLNKKGKAWKFDDANCLVNFLKTEGPAADQIAGIYVVNHATASGQLIPVDQAVFLKSEGLKTPMASQIAAFGRASEAEVVQNKLGGEVLDWGRVKAEF